MKVKNVEQDIELDFKGTVLGLLKKLELSPVEFLVVVDGELAPEGRKLKGCESVRIIPVVKGG